MELFDAKDSPVFFSTDETLFLARFMAANGFLRS